MKKPPSKTDLRERLQRQTAAFLSSGGKVKEFRAGESAYDRKEKPILAPELVYSHSHTSLINARMSSIYAC